MATSHPLWVECVRDTDSHTQHGSGHQPPGVRLRSWRSFRP